LDFSNSYKFQALTPAFLVCIINKIAFPEILFLNELFISEAQLNNISHCRKIWLM